MRRLNLLDTAFVRMESPSTPMHVGGLLTFQLPPRAPKRYLQTLLEKLRRHPFTPSPFDCRLHWSPLRMLPPSWEPAEADVDYHIRHSALPYPGGERELGVLVARLHSNPMDLSRPPWECHLIEGLENRRFALYFKAHHCAIDGMGAMRMVKSWLSDDPTEKRSPGELVARHTTAGGRGDGKAADMAGADAGQAQRLLESWLQRARNGGDNVQDFLRTLGRLGQGGNDSVLRSTIRTPRTLFNVPVSPQRRLGTQLLSLQRFRAIAEATDSTINDVTLAICGGAARRYLEEMDALPEASLTASVPIGLPRTDGKPGNAVSGFVCPLATDTADPLARLQRIRTVTARTKRDMLAASSVTLERFGMFGIAPLMLGQLSGTLPLLPPLFNIVVSNVVASQQPLYLMGSRLEAIYPMSILFDGYALNLTVVGYAGHVAVGYTGCRNAVPSLQKLAVYTGEALDALEKAVGV